MAEFGLTKAEQQSLAARPDGYYISGFGEVTSKTGAYIDLEQGLMEVSKPRRVKLVGSGSAHRVLLYKVMLKYTSCIILFYQIFFPNIGIV